MSNNNNNEEWLNSSPCALLVHRAITVSGWEINICQHRIGFYCETVGVIDFGVRESGENLAQEIIDLIFCHFLCEHRYL